MDVNALHYTGGAEDLAMEEILQLRDDGVVDVFLPHSVKTELEHPNTPADVKHRATQFTFSEPVQLTPQEQATHEEIRALIKGNAQSDQHNMDAFHLVEAAKYGGYFITNDGRLLKKADDIWQRLHLKVLKPSGFLKAYRQTE